VRGGQNALAGGRFVRRSPGKRKNRHAERSNNPSRKSTLDLEYTDRSSYFYLLPKVRRYFLVFLTCIPEARPPLPPFTFETATQKTRAAEDAWNSRNPAQIALAYTPDSQWRNRSDFFTGRAAIEAFLTRK